MARLVHGLLLSVCCLLLLQVSECSRPPSPSLADHDDLQLHHQLLLLDAEARTKAWPPTSTELVAPADGRTVVGDDDAALSSAWATPARAVASSPPLQASDRPALLARAGTTRSPVLPLLRSKLARRFLAGAGVYEAASGSGSATDGTTGASCHSFDPHTNCPPASKH